MQQEQRKAAGIGHGDGIVRCGQCDRFIPGSPIPAMSLGSCGATKTGEPPAGQAGDYRAAFPTAPRHCEKFRVRS